MRAACNRMTDSCVALERVVDMLQARLRVSSGPQSQSQSAAQKSKPRDDAREEILLMKGYLNQCKSDIDAPTWNGNEFKHRFSVFRASVEYFRNNIFRLLPTMVMKMKVRDILYSMVKYVVYIQEASVLDRNSGVYAFNEMEYCVRNLETELRDWMGLVK